MLDDLTELPEGWEVCTFGDIFDIKGGNQPPKSEFIDSPQSGYVRLLQIRDFESDKLAIYIKDDERLPKCSVDDLLIARYGASLGRICTGKSGSYNVALTKVIFDHDNLDRNWVKLFLESDWFQAPLFLVSRSAQNGFNKDELFPRSVPLPPLNEQKRIVAKIEELRSHTQAARSAIAHIPKLLEQFRQSVLAAAFRGDLTAEWRSENPDVEPAEILLQRIRKERLLGNRLTSSDTDLPSKWLWTNAIECCERVIDCHNKTAPYRKSGIKLVRTTNIRSGSINTEETMFVDQETYDYWSRRCPPQPGDILFTREAPMAEVGMIPENEKLCMGQRMMLLRPDNFNLLGVYLLFVLQSPYIKDYVERIAVGTGVKHLRVKDVEGLPIPLSPLLEQKVITEKLLSYMKIIDRIEEQYQFTKTELDRLDRSILAKAFKGELVPQDPTDEAAIVLLERIREMRLSQIKPAKTKRKKA